MDQPSPGPCRQPVPLAERHNRPFALVPDLKLPGTLPWHAFRAILAAWDAALASDWHRVASDYVALHFVPCQALHESQRRQRRQDVEDALHHEILELAEGGWQ